MSDEKKEEFSSNAVKIQQPYEITDVRITGIYSVNEIWTDSEGKQTKEIYNGFTVGWASKGIGFGEFQVRQHEDGRIVMATEHMSKDFVTAVLAKMVTIAEIED
jgi:hypothetical protein